MKHRVLLLHDGLVAAWSHTLARTNDEWSAIVPKEGKKKGQDEEKGKEERADWWECGGKEELDGEDERAVHERRKEEVGCFRIGLCTYTQ